MPEGKKLHDVKRGRSTYHERKWMHTVFHAASQSIMEEYADVFQGIGEFPALRSQRQESSEYA